MTSRPSIARVWCSLLAGGLVLAACGGSDGNAPGPTTGTLRVTTTTSGAELDPDGYTVALDGAGSTAIGINASLSVSQVPPGSHSVQLNGAAANCTVTAPNPVSVTVTAGGSVTAAFTIGCTATTGFIQASAATTGVEAPQSYDVAIDGAAAGQVGSNASFTFGPYAVGNHTVELTLPANCSTGTANPMTVAIPAASATPTVPAAFSVTCQATEGNIEVQATTTGVNVPLNYDVAIDGSAVGQVGSNANFTFGPYPVGNHTVELTLPANCSAGTANPVTVTIPTGTSTPTVQASFTLSCDATEGYIDVRPTTTGVNVPVAYDVTIDGTGVGQVGSNASFTFGPYPVGNHTVELTLPANCSASTANPLTVTIPTGGGTPTVQATFALSCQATEGYIDVRPTTTGVNVPLTYDVTIDGVAVGQAGSNASYTFGPYPVGSHTVELTLPANCSASTANPLTVTIPTGASTPTVQAAFSVSCQATEGYIDVRPTTTGSNVPTAYDVSIDATAVGQVGSNASYTFGPYPVGNHSVELTLPGNCSASTANPLTVTIPTGNTTPTVQATFTISCVP